MRLRPSVLGLALLLFASCSPADTPTQPSVEAGTGALLDTPADVPTFPMENPPSELLEESIDAAGESYEDPVQPLRLSYEQAVVLRDILRELLPQMPPELREAIREPLAVFEDDIAMLKHYVDIAEREPLTDEETLGILELTAQMEEAMALFGQVVEMQM